MSNDQKPLAAFDLMTLKYLQELRAHMASLSDKEAKEAAAAIVGINTRNCDWHLYCALPLIEEVVQEDSARRHNETSKEQPT